MSQQRTSDYQHGWLLWIQLAVPVVALGFAWVISGFHALGNAIAAEATYECANQHCETNEAETVIAAYTIWLVTITGVLAAFTGALFVATYALFYTASKDGERALSQAKELFAAERRPWIRLKFEVISNMHVFVGGHGEVVIRATATNIGLSPAMRTRLGRRAEILTVDELNFVDVEERLERARMTRIASGVTLFPGEMITQDWTVTVQNARTEWGIGGGPIVAGWVTYKFSPDDERAHATPLVMELTWRGEPDFLEGYPPEQMSLRLLPIQLVAD